MDSNARRLTQERRNKNGLIQVEDADLPRMRIDRHENRYPGLYKPGEDSGGSRIRRLDWRTRCFDVIRVSTVRR